MGARPCDRRSHSAIILAITLVVLPYSASRLAADGSAAAPRTLDTVGTSPPRWSNDEAHKLNLDVVYIGFSPDSKTVLSVGRDGVVRRWDAATGKSAGQFTVADTPYPHTADLSRDGKRLAVASTTGTGIYDVDSGKRVAGPIKGHRSYAYSLTFNSDGTKLVTGGEEGNVILWDARTGDQPRVIAGAQNQTGRSGDAIRCVRMTPDEKTLVTSQYNRTFQAWDCKEARELQFWRADGPKGSTGHFALSPDGKHLVSSMSYEYFRVWNYPSGRGRGTTLFPSDMIPRPGRQRKEMLCVDIDRRGQFFAVCGSNGFVGVWELATGQPLHVYTSTERLITRLAFSPDGSKLVAGDRHGGLWAWDVEGWRVDPGKGRSADELWTLLASPDAVAARRAAHDLLATPDRAVPLLRERLQAVPRVDLTQLDGWVRTLSDPKFTIRQEAAARLRALGPTATYHLQARLSGDLPADARRALDAIIADLEAPFFDTDQARLVRAVDALGRMKDTGAGEVLRELERRGETDFLATLAGTALSCP